MQARGSLVVPNVPSFWESALWFSSGNVETSWGQPGWKARPLDQRSPQCLGVCHLPVPHSERERDLAEAYLPAVFCQEERVIPSGKGPCYSEAPTVRASTSASHGALPGEGPSTYLYTPVADRSLRVMSLFPVPPFAQLPTSIVPVSHKPYPRHPSLCPPCSLSLSIPFLIFLLYLLSIMPQRHCFLGFPLPGF